MSLLKPKTLEERILTLLFEGEIKTTDLLARLSESGKKPTKQGFYVALRKLKAEDMTVVYKGVAALNVTWVKRMGETLEKINAVYGGESLDVLSLADKESISYSFSTLRQLDNYWGHIQDLVVKATSPNEAVYTYDPHYWFYLARPEIEKAHINLINTLGKQFLMTVGAATPLDRVVQRDFDNQMRQYHMEKFFEDDTYYVVVTGDYIFETHFDDATAKRIEDIYAQHTELNDAAITELQQIPEIRVRTRLKLSRNATRARKLKRKLAKNFLVKKD